MTRGAPAFPERITAPRFAQGAPKSVDYSNAFQASAVAPGSVEQADLLEIIRCIGAGNLLPERCYRNGVDRDHDELLADYGIKHLHLGGSNSDTMLFLVEYESSVLLLEIADHRAFRDSPPGSALRSLHAHALRTADAQSASDRAKRVAAKSNMVLRGLLPKKK